MRLSTGEPFPFSLVDLPADVVILKLRTSFFIVCPASPHWLWVTLMTPLTFHTSFLAPPPFLRFQRLDTWATGGEPFSSLNWKGCTLSFSLPQTRTEAVGNVGFYTPLVLSLQHVPRLALRACPRPLAQFPKFTSLAFFMLPSAILPFCAYPVFFLRCGAFPC